MAHPCAYGLSPVSDQRCLLLRVWAGVGSFFGLEASNMQEAGLNFNKKGGMDFKRLDDDDPAIYAFPPAPQRLGWNGRPV